MAVLNSSDAPVGITPQVFAADRSAESVAALPSMVVPPHEAMLVDTSALRELDVDRVSVRVVSDGAPGALVGYLAAVDPASLTAYELPLRDAGPMRQSTGNYPWRLDGDYSSIASIANVGATGGTFSAVITYAGGVYRVAPELLQPGATATFDLRKIRDQRLPGLDGGVLPADAAKGQFKWSIAGPVFTARLNGRMEIVSKRTGQSSSYSCGQCCPDSYYYGILNPVPVTTASGASMGFSVLSQMQTCSGSTGGQLYAYANSWYVADTSITSVTTTGYGTASADGLDGGASDISGSWTAYRYEPFGEDCNEIPVDAGGNGSVQVRKPTSLSTLSGSYVDSPPPPYDYKRVYQILDQNGQAMPGYPSLYVTETYTPNPPSGNCTIGTITTGAGYADANGRFPDDYTASSLPSPCSSSSTQKHFVNGIQVSTKTVTWTHTGVTINP